MSVEIHISGADVAEVRKQLRVLLGDTDSLVNRQAESADTASTTASEVQGEQTTQKRTRGRPAKKEVQAAAETEVDKTIPDADDEADAAQDDADEQQDAAATDAEANGKLTHDDVRAALARYMKKFGIGPTQLDGPKVLSMMFGENATKASDVPNTQEDIGKAIAGIEEMLAKNPFKRTPV